MKGNVKGLPYATCEEPDWPVTPGLTHRGSLGLFSQHPGPGSHYSGSSKQSLKESSGSSHIGIPGGSVRGQPVNEGSPWRECAISASLSSPKVVILLSRPCTYPCQASSQRQCHLLALLSQCLFLHATKRRRDLAACDNCLCTPLLSIVMGLDVTPTKNVLA